MNRFKCYWFVLQNLPSLCSAIYKKKVERKCAWLMHRENNIPILSQASVINSKWPWEKKQEQKRYESPPVRQTRCLLSTSMWITSPLHSLPLPPPFSQNPLRDRLVKRTRPASPPVSPSRLSGLGRGLMKSRPPSFSIPPAQPDHH